MYYVLSGYSLERLKSTQSFVYLDHFIANCFVFKLRAINGKHAYVIKYLANDRYSKNIINSSNPIDICFNNLHVLIVSIIDVYANDTNYDSQ